MTPLQVIYKYIKENYPTKINITLIYVFYMLYPEMIRIGHNYACVFLFDSDIVFSDLDTGMRTSFPLGDPKCLDDLIDFIKKYDADRQCSKQCLCRWPIYEIQLLAQRF